ncbi:hypothetical protein [Kitasatospora sp. NPDC096140]|uniref:hypothetical protein n=1 Tax=Kitasatospora sp. NPDC096140 TaxID=3155425 RepID=UPI003329C532
MHASTCSAPDGGERFAPAVRLTGTRNDCTRAETVIALVQVCAGPGSAHTRPERVVADKGHSSRAFRAYLRQRGTATRYDRTSTTTEQAVTWLT